MKINGIECVTVQEAAVIIGVSAGRVRQLINKDKPRLPSIQVGKRMRWIPREAVEAFAKLDRPDGKRISQ